MMMFVRMVMIVFAARTMLVVTLFRVVGCFFVVFAFVGFVMIVLLMAGVFMFFFVFVMGLMLGSLLVVFSERIAQGRSEGE